MFVSVKMDVQRRARRVFRLNVSPSRVAAVLYGIPDFNGYQQYSTLSSRMQA